MEDSGSKTVRTGGKILRGAPESPWPSEEGEPQTPLRAKVPSSSFSQAKKRSVPRGQESLSGETREEKEGSVEEGGGFSLQYCGGIKKTYERKKRNSQSFWEPTKPPQYSLSFYRGKKKTYTDARKMFHQKEKGRRYDACDYGGFSFSKGPGEKKGGGGHPLGELKDFFGLTNKERREKAIW